MIQLLSGAAPGSVSDPLVIRPAYHAPFELTYYCVSTVSGDTFDILISPFCDLDVWEKLATVTPTTATEPPGSFMGQYQQTIQAERVRVRFNEGSAGLGTVVVVPET